MINVVTEALVCVAVVLSVAVVELLPCVYHINPSIVCRHS